jgi:hypothetical protein
MSQAPAVQTAAPLLSLEDWVHTLQFWQFSQLTVDQIVYLTPQQVATIPSSDAFSTIAAPVRAALTPPQVQALNVGNISISLLTPTQTGWLTASQIQSLKFWDFKYLSATQIPSLTAAQIATVPNATAFADWSAASRGALNAAQVQALNVANVRINLLTSQQVGWLKTTQIQATQFFDFQYLNAAQTPSLTTAQIATMPNSYILLDWSPAARAALTTAQVQSITTTSFRINLLTSQQVSWLKTTQIQALQFYDFGNLQASQIPSLTAAQIASIPNFDVLTTWTAAARAALTPFQVQALSMPNLRIHLFTSQQVSWLRDAQIQILKYYDFSYLNVAQIPRLTVAQIASIPNFEVLTAWSTAELAALTPGQIRALSMPNLRIYAFTPDQVSWLTAAQIQILPYYDFHYLNAAQTPFLTPAQLRTVPNTDDFAAWSASARAALTVPQVQALNVSQVSISLLTPQQASWLRGDQIWALKFYDFRYLNAAQIPWLTTAQVATVPNADSFSDWSASARAALNVAQVQALDVVNVRINLLTPQQASWLRGDQIQALKYFDFIYLTPAQIPWLTTAQMAAVPGADVLRSLSDAAQAALTRDQLLALPLDVWAQFSRIEPSQTPPSNYKPVVDQVIGADGLSDHAREEEQKIYNLVPLASATHVTVASGNWSDPRIWRNGQVPAAGAKVVVSAGTTVTFDAFMNFAVDTLRIDGTLEFAVNRNTQLKADTIVVHHDGTLHIGTENNPIQSNVTANIVITNDGPIDTAWDPYLLSRGLISCGEVRMFGSVVTPYVSLAVAPSSGDTKLYLSSLPANWKVGDELVVAGTQLTEDFGTDRVTIRSINGTTVTIDPLKYSHLPPGGYGFSVQVANLNRNIDFIAENPTVASQRPHMGFFHNPNVQLSYISVDGFGRTDKTKPINDPVVVNGVLMPGTGTNPRARYAIHFHHDGVDPAVAPATVRGSVVIDSAGWGYVNHQSNVVMEDNVAFEVVGASFVTEDGNEIGAMRRNLSINSRGADSFDVNRYANHDFGFLGNGFWFQGPGVEVEDNIAAGSRSAAFSYFMLSSQALFDAVNLKDPTLAGGKDAIPGASVPFTTFKGNTAYAAATGMDVWYSMRLMTDGESVIDDFTAWNTSYAGIQLNYSSHIKIQDALLIGDLDRFQGDGISTNRWTHDITINNLRAEGYEIGVDVPVRRSTVINGARISALQGLFIGKGQDTIRQVDVEGSFIFIPPPAAVLAGRQAYRFYLSPELDPEDFLERPVESLFSEDSIRIAVNGNTPMKLHYFEQYLYLTPFPSTVLKGYVPDQYLNKTNAELWQTFGVAFSGGPPWQMATLMPDIRAAVEFTT